MDTTPQLFIGDDIAPIPTENLLKIYGITHAKKQQDGAFRLNISRQLLVGQATPSSSVHGVILPCLIGVAIETHIDIGACS